MSESTITTQPETPKYQRVFWPRDYARIADALRRARKGKTPEQLVVVDSMTAAVAAFLADDFNQADNTFDTGKFRDAAKLRVETTQLEEYQAWAAKHDADPEAAALNQQKFYDTRYSPGSAADVELPGDDSDDEDDEPDDGSLNLG